MTTRTRSSFYPTALVTLVLGLVLSATCAWLLGRANEARIQAAVDDIVQETTESVFNRVQLYQYGLRGVRGAVLTAGDNGLTKQLFRRYAESRDIAQEFPGARGFGFVRRVPQGAEAAFLAKARAETPGFNISSLGPHEGDKWFIHYIEPNQGNRSAIGFDIASEPHRRKAMQEAVDTGEVRLTQPITLMQEQSRPQQSFLIIMPVYRGPKTPATVEERRDQAIGLSYAPLLMTEVLQGLRIDDNLLHVRLSDFSGGNALPITFFDNDDGEAVPGGLYPRSFDRDVFGRQWRFEFSVTKTFIARLGIIAPAYLWLGGLLLSLVLAGLAGAIAVSRAQRREIAYARMELGAIVESTSDAIIGKTLEGVISSWNRGAEQLFGFTAREAIGRPITGLIVPAERAGEEAAMLARVARGDSELHFETVRVHKNGRRLEVDITSSPVRGINGQIVGASVTARDITLQKAQTARIEGQNEALKEQVHDSQATTQAILDTVIDPVLSITEGGTVVSFNPASTRVFGYEAYEIIGQHVTRLMPQSNWSAYDQFVARTLESAIPNTRSQEIQGLRKDGSVFPARVSVGMKQSGDARVFVCVVTDITNEINQRNELLAARDHLLLAADAAELGIWTYNLADQSLAWNKRMYELYGMRASELERPLHYEDWLRRLYPEDVHRCDAVMKGLLERQEPYALTFRVRLPNGQVRHIQAGGRVELDADGRPQRVIGINRDITLQQEIEATLRQAKASADEASAAKSAFLANMSHEIRTPLNAVLGMLQLMQRTVLDGQQRDYVAKARQAARSLLELLNDILDYSKIEAGKLKLDSHAFELDELLTELAVIIAGNQGGKEVEAVFDIDPAVPSTLVGDTLRLKQVLVNLVGNALKFTLSGEVVIHLSVVHREDAHVTLRFSVSDTGIGISPEQRERIFEGFSQAEASTSRRFGGTGLGLVISNRLVVLMGGELKLESEVGVGSRFWFDVPLKVQGGGANVSSQPGRGLPLRLLVVDDNPTSADVLSRTVQALGWTAQHALSGKEAIERIRRVAGTAVPYDVVLMDWRMPDLDGVATAKRIQAELPPGQAPYMVMVTAYADRLSLLEPLVYKTLFAATLTKPVTPRQLRDCILGVVEGRLLPPPAPERQPKRLAGLHMLVVEDNAVNRQVASGLLHLEGANVTLAENGVEALAALADAPNTYDAVLMDVQMPEMDGLEATRRIRLDSRFAHLPIIAMTANASTEDRQACLAAGMDDHISKPVDLASLVQCLESWIGRRRSGPEQGVPAAPSGDGLLEAWSTLTGRFGGDLELLRNVLAIFSADTRELLQRLEELAPGGDRLNAKAIFHAIKGSAANIGAQALSLRAGKLEASVERDAKDGSQDGQGLDLNATARELKALLEASEEQLQARLG